MNKFKSRPFMVAYCIAMAVVSTTCLLCTIIYWYKGVWPVLIVVGLGYWGAGIAYNNRKPIIDIDDIDVKPTVSDEKTGNNDDDKYGPDSTSEWYDAGA